MRSFTEWSKEEHPELMEFLGGIGKKGDDWEDWVASGEEEEEKEKKTAGTVSAPGKPVKKPVPVNKMKKDGQRIKSGRKIDIKIGDL